MNLNWIGFVNSKPTLSLLNRLCVTGHWSHLINVWLIHHCSYCISYEITVHVIKIVFSVNYNLWFVVQQALKDEIKAMHGLRIFTDVPRV